MTSASRKIRGQDSWQLRSDRVSLAVTVKGGHVAPVVFRLGGREVAPYSVAPWAEEKVPPGTPEILKALRGDFFCAPFGGNATPFRGEHHPVHGDSANLRWRLEALAATGQGPALHLCLKTKTRPGVIRKAIELLEGETNLYVRHTLEGMSGPMSFGHHAMLKFPDREGAGIVSTSRILFGQVAPEPFENPAGGGYQCLRRGSRFSTLERVMQADGRRADLSRYPARRGFEDLVMVVHEAAPDFAWVAVTFPEQRYVWFSLKDPSVLRSTVFWISNGGRHYPPWNGRHTGVLGIEDVTSYFHYGLAESVRANPVSRLGYPTSRLLRGGQAFSIPYIMGVAAIPSGFDKVTRIERTGAGILLTSAAGRKARARVDVSFLTGSGH